MIALNGRFEPKPEPAVAAFHRRQQDAGMGMVSFPRLPALLLVVGQYPHVPVLATVPTSKGRP